MKERPARLGVDIVDMRGRIVTEEGVTAVCQGQGAPDGGALETRRHPTNELLLPSSYASERRPRMAGARSSMSPVHGRSRSSRRWRFRAASS